MVCFNQYDSGLPKDFYDVKGSTKAIDHFYQFDTNANLKFLRDDQNRLYDLDLSYDNLDRLETIHDSFMGSGFLEYDTMGNIERYKIGSQNIDYHYTEQKRLDSTSGYSAGTPDIVNWQHYGFYSNTTAGSLNYDVGPINTTNVPRTSNTSGSDYAKLYLRMRTSNSAGASYWRYTRPIWVYYND